MENSIITNLLKYAAEHGCTPIPTRSLQDVMGRHIPPPDQVIADFVDVGDIMAIIGKSKMRKSFFCLQLGLSLALGKPFMAHQVTRPKRVLMLQLEVQKDHYERRMQRMVHSMLGDTWALAENLTNFRVMHGRGQEVTPESVAEMARVYEPEVLIVDPAYLLMESENDTDTAKEFTKVLSKIAETNITIIYVHHDKKGTSGDQELVDRGSGSGVFGRAYDAAMYLDPHAESDEHTVLSYKTRNYKSPEPQAMTWDRFLFAPDEEESGLVSTSHSANSKAQRSSPIQDLASAAVSTLPNRPLWVSEALDMIRDELRIGEKRARSVLNHLRNPELGIFIEEKHEKGKIKLIRREQDSDKKEVTPWD